MDLFQEKVDLLKRYYDDICSVSTNNGFYIKGEIPNKKLDVALRTFGQGVDRSTIIGFYDTTVFLSGKRGYIFTDTKVAFLELMEKPKKFWYEDIESMEITRMYEDDDRRYLKLTMKDGSTVSFEDFGMNKTPLRDFLQEMIDLSHPKPKTVTPKIDYTTTQTVGAMAAGYAAAAPGAVNKGVNEEKFHARQGHGFAAERANNLFDELAGHDAQIVGDNNAKNGADRIVDGVYIQSKYCATGSRCVNECFAEDGKGAFRYMQNGKPMQIEVPSDLYDAAVEAMEHKIKNGQVEGVSNPAEAQNIIRKGHFTYAQARNIAKAGTVESLVYDAVNGMVIAKSAFGVTAVITFAASVWQGEDIDVALKAAVCSGLKVGGAAFVTTVLAGQLSKAGLNSALVGSSEAVVALMGPKASAFIVNVFRTEGSKIYGAAAQRRLASLMRNNAVTAVIMVTVLSAGDIASIFSGKISGKQLFKNMTNTAAGLAGGAAGAFGAGAALGSFVPGVGNLVGGLVGLAGAMVGGSAAYKAADSVTGTFIEDDAEEMVRIIQRVFEKMAEEYLLSQKEAEKSVDRLRDRLDGKVLKNMYASSDRRVFARNLLTPIIEQEVAYRPRIANISDGQIVACLRDVFEEMADVESVGEWGKLEKTNQEIDDEKAAIMKHNAAIIAAMSKQSYIDIN